MAQPTSGIQSQGIALGDIGLEAFSRIQVRPASIGPNHMHDLRLSAQFLQSEWSNAVPNLWQIDQQTIVLEQGVATYAVPPNTITILDSVIRQFQLGGPVNAAVNFTTSIGSAVVTVVLPNNGMIPGSWIQIFIPVSVGGLILQAFYQVQSVIDPNTFTIKAATAALATEINGGAVPILSGNSTTTAISVTLINHGLFVGNNFTIQVTTTVGGVPLQGVYPVASVIDANNFTITAPYAPSTSSVARENGGLAQFLLQSTTYQPQDRVVTSISRTDYNNQPNKFQQAYPTTYWYDRLINPQITFWPVPDGNGPYVFYYYRMVQADDAVVQNGTSVQIPYRFFDAYAAGLAARLARKYMPQLAAELKMEAKEAFDLAQQQDWENAPLFISPILSSYYR